MGPMVLDSSSLLNSSISACRQSGSWSLRMASAYVKSDPSVARVKDETAEDDVAVVRLRVTGGSGRVFDGSTL